jgi:hypothetical protein
MAKRTDAQRLQGSELARDELRAQVGDLERRVKALDLSAIELRTNTLQIAKQRDHYQALATALAAQLKATIDAIALVTTGAAQQMDYAVRQSLEGKRP